MKLYYDPDVDALYLRLADVTVADSEEVRPGVILDFDDQDRVVAVEILNVKKHFPNADVKRLQLEVASN
ncbi:MAG: DUF2283 domain-containing protein [Planctomycetes bacterium]|nr:DUF2283 domain-containing protein [Planctomycetota bacterium]